MNFEDRAEQLFQAPCWVIDPLPFQVPAGSEGQFFAVEDHWLKPPQITELRQRFVRLLQKLNCYCDLEVAHPDEPVPVRNPAPEELARKMTDAQSEWVILIPSQDTLITLSRGDLYMSVYHPSDRHTVFLQQKSPDSTTNCQGFFLSVVRPGDAYSSFAISFRIVSS